MTVNYSLLICMLMGFLTSKTKTIVSKLQMVPIVFYYNNETNMFKKKNNGTNWYVLLTL